MDTIKVDFSANTGKIKPMHAVNNGPVYKFTQDQRITNIDAFRDAQIPYARTHDASINYGYGGEHVVDITGIFPDFDKDPTDPDSYDFVLTNEYLKVMVYAGVKPFYRLGNKIEHWPKKYGTLPPKDFKKWAVICEHIIRHYTEGWANGFNYDIEYWEIWNEPDGAPDDADYVDKKCWGSTMAEFFDFFDIAAKYLKQCFPDKKIGGPALTVGISDWAHSFLAYCKENKTPLDFYSWHIYCADPKEVLKTESDVREFLNSYGFEKTQSILNEWNYVKGWTNDEWIYSLKSEKSLKGASFAASVMFESQYQPLDMLMYYDARPCAMNGLFSTDFVCDKLKGYYPFKMFNELSKLGSSVKTESDCSNLYCCASKNENTMAFVVSYFNDEETQPEKQIKINFKNTDGKERKISYYLLDETHDNELVREEIVCQKNFSSFIKMSLFSTYLIKIEEI